MRNDITITGLHGLTVMPEVRQRISLLVVSIHMPRIETNGLFIGYYCPLIVPKFYKALFPYSKWALNMLWIEMYCPVIGCHGLSIVLKLIKRLSPTVVSLHMLLIEMHCPVNVY